MGTVPETGDNHARKCPKMTRTTQKRRPDLARFQRLRKTTERTHPHDLRLHRHHNNPVRCPQRSHVEHTTCRPFLRRPAVSPPTGRWTRDGTEVGPRMPGSASSPLPRGLRRRPRRRTHSVRAHRKSGHGYHVGNPPGLVSLIPCSIESSSGRTASNWSVLATRRAVSGFPGFSISNDTAVITIPHCWCENEESAIRSENS